MTPPRLDEGSEREAFEAWAKQYGRIFLDRQPHGPYMHAFTQEAWVGWQARAALSTGRLGGEATLKGRADALIQAGHAFWQACRVEAGGGAVRWLNATDGTTIIFTRGEYAQQLLARINEDYQGPVTVFEHTDPEDEERGVVAKAAPAAQSQGEKS
jgi:hypothetical protein